MFIALDLMDGQYDNDEVLTLQDMLSQANKREKDAQVIIRRFKREMETLKSELRSTNEAHKLEMDRVKEASGNLQDKKYVDLSYCSTCF